MILKFLKSVFVKKDKEDGYLQLLLDQMKSLRQVIDDKRCKVPYSDDFHKDLINCCKAESDEYDKLSREYRIKVKPKLNTLEKCDFMTIETFIEYCKEGMFIDYDGHGYYCTENKESDIIIYPSDIEANKYRKDFKYINWYNK